MVKLHCRELYRSSLSLLRQKKFIEYLVKWRGYGPEFCEWYGEDLFNDAVDLMLEYELRSNPDDAERINYLKKLAAGKENTARDNGEVFTSSRRGRGRPKGSKNKKG